MTDLSKIKATHTQRAALVYLRQSTPSQVEHNRESTARQYALADQACQLGWSKQQVVILDEDLGLSGSSTDKRSGFTRMTSEVPWLTPASSSVWKSRGWRATMPTGIACWSCAASPTRSSATTTASITRRCSTIACCWASIDLIHKAPLVQLSPAPVLFGLGPGLDLFRLCDRPSRRQM